MKKHKQRTAFKTLLLILMTVMLLLASFAGCGKEQEPPPAEPSETQVSIEYTFRYDDLLQSHYKKHGIEMGFDSPEAYLAAANAVISNPDALTKTEKEDGDLVYYVEDTNEFLVLSTDGYIRTYFYPDSGRRYFDKQ